jgi:hypothetical protein
MVTKDDSADQKPSEQKGNNPLAQKGPGGKVQDKAPGAQPSAADVSKNTKTSAGRNAPKPDNDLGAPDPEEVIKNTVKAEAARDELAQKNAVSVSKDDDKNVIGVATEHFNVARADHHGIEVINVSKRGYVGPPQLTITNDELEELVDALDKF